MNAQMDAPPQTTPGSMSLHQPPRSFQLRGDIAISLSICESDFKSAQALMDLILLAEPLNHVDLVLSIAGGPEILDDRQWFDFLTKATGFFRSVKINKARDIRPLHTASEGSLARDWRPNNSMFRAVADYFQHFAPEHGAFYYLEPDCTLLKRDWFSQLSAQYQLGRKPFMGAIRQAKKNDGSSLPRHMNGSGFYPNPVVTYSQALYAASMNQHPEAAPFDVAGGVTVTPQCQPTTLICVDFNANPALTPDAVVWHGDKRDQMKFTMIEKWGGGVQGGEQVARMQEGSAVITSTERPHFQETLSTDLERMPERIRQQVAAQMTVPPADDDFLGASDAPPKGYASAESLQAINRMASEPPRITPPANAYEAYLRALKAFGHDKASWMRAVKEFKKHRPEPKAKK